MRHKVKVIESMHHNNHMYNVFFSGGLSNEMYTKFNNKSI